MRGTEVITLKKKEEAVVIRRKNQIPLPNLNNFVNAVYYWLTGSSPKIQSCQSNGMILLNGNIVVATLPIVGYYVASVSNNIISLVFFAEDSSQACYTTDAQKLVVKIAGYNIYLSLGNISATKKSCCTLSINWIISFCVSGNFTPIYTTSYFINFYNGRVINVGSCGLTCARSCNITSRTNYLPINSSFPTNAINLYLFYVIFCTQSVSSCIYVFNLNYGTINGITCYWTTLTKCIFHPQNNIISFYSCSVQGAKMYYFGVHVVYNVGGSSCKYGAGLIVVGLGGGVVSARQGYQVSLCFTV